MTKPGRPEGGRWAGALTASILLHASVAAGLAGILSFAPQSLAPAPDATPPFAIRFAPIPPATLAGIVAVPPDSARIVRQDPPEGLPELPGTGSPSDPATPVQRTRPADVATLSATPIVPIAPVAVTPSRPAPIISPVTTAGSGGRDDANDASSARTDTSVPPPVPVDTPSDRPQTGSVRPIPDPGPVSVQDIAVSALLARVARLPGTDCTLVLPRRAGAEEAALSLIGPGEATLESIADTVLRDDLWDTPQTRALIDRRQCPAIDWIRDTAAYPATPLGLGLETQVIASGMSMRGTVQGAAGRFLTLLLIDDNGVVQDLTGFATVSGDTARFDVPVTRDGPGRDTRQIVVALATPDPATVLQARAGQAAQDVFADLPAELSRADLGIEVVDIR